MSGKRTKQKKRRNALTTTKRVVWACLVNGICWVWCSYILAYLGRGEIAETLSRTAVTEIVAVVLVYCTKALFEKQPRFGSVGAKTTDSKDGADADEIPQI